MNPDKNSKGLFSVLKDWLTDNETGDRNIGIFCMILVVVLAYIMTGSIVLAKATYEFHPGIFGFSVTTAILSGIAIIVSIILGLIAFSAYYDW